MRDKINMAATSDTPNMFPITHEGKGVAKRIIQLSLVLGSFSHTAAIPLIVLFQEQLALQWTHQIQCHCTIV